MKRFNALLSHKSQNHLRPNTSPHQTSSVVRQSYLADNWGWFSKMQTYCNCSAASVEFDVALQKHKHVIYKYDLEKLIGRYHILPLHTHIQNQTLGRNIFITIQLKFLLLVLRRKNVYHCSHSPSSICKIKYQLFSNVIESFFNLF